MDMEVEEQDSPMKHLTALTFLLTRRNGVSKIKNDVRLDDSSR